MPGFLVDGNWGTPHRTSAESRREYYYNYTWDLTSVFEIYSPSSLPQLVCLKEMGTPTFTVNKEHYQGASLEYKFAKSVVWDDIKVTWYDTVGLLSIVRQWRQSVWTPEQGLKQANEYKKTTLINSFLPTGQSEQSWRLINSWPSQIRHGDLTYTSSEVKLVEVAITYDWADELPPQ